MLSGTATDGLVRASISTRERFERFSVVRSVAAPNSWFANCLILDRPPEPAAYGMWIAEHASAFANAPVERRIVQWEIDECRGLEDYAGPFERECNTVLTAMQQRDLAGTGRAEQSPFEAWLFRIYRMDAAAGRRRAWGVWDGERLVAFAGLYANERWARFFNPITNPAYRRRGLFGAIASVAMRETLHAHPEATVVIVGEQHALIAPV